jgi:hypothetical protein
MSIIRRIAGKFLPIIINHFSPAKYRDNVFVPEFLKAVNLKMISLGKTIRCFERGFLPFEHLWYDLENNDYRNYIPARVNYQHRFVNGSYGIILGNKILFEKFLGNIISGIDGLHIVGSLGYIEKGKLYSLHRDLETGNYSSLLSLLKASDLILKQVCGDGGEGLKCLSNREGHLFINNQGVDVEEMKSFLTGLDNYLIQRRLLQNGLAGEINPGSVNTMRIGTMIDPDSGKPFMAYAVHRFGSPGSGFVDNVGQGGITAWIDIKDGRLSMAHHYSKDGQMYFYERHPVTSVVIQDRVIPNWDDLKRRITAMAGRMPYLKYVGWDFMLSNNELYVLEGNLSPALGLVQLYGSLKENPQAWSFFKHYGYV